jgi:hypothetical protein
LDGTTRFCMFTSLVVVDDIELVRRLKIDRHADELVDLLHMATSFETYDAIAGSNRSEKQAASLIQRACRALIASE